MATTHNKGRGGVGKAGPRSRVRFPGSPERLLHELEVHQVELETQNAELTRARGDAEEALTRVTNLYDFAPVGYLSVDQRGVIQEANLTAASMLGTTRSTLILKDLRTFVSPASRSTVCAFLHQACGPERRACEAQLVTATGVRFWADLQASQAFATPHVQSWCGLAIADITAVKRGEAAQIHADSLAAANREANLEIERRRAAEAQARELQAQCRSLTHQVLSAQENERKQISRQLHDEIVQTLAGVKLQLSALSVAELSKSRELRQRIAKARRLIGRSIVVVHRFARALRPALLDDLGLIPALRSYIRNLPGRRRLVVKFTADPEVEKLDSVQRTTLYRIAQEALTNIVRHARARVAIVRLLRIRDAVRLEVCDNGRSFSVDRVLASEHLGLLGMRERIEMVGGSFFVESTPGAGTLVRAEIPLPGDTQM